MKVNASEKKPSAKKRWVMRIAAEAAALFRRKLVTNVSPSVASYFRPALHPPQATPSDTTMAMDDALGAYGGWAGGNIGSAAYLEGTEFLGYPTLSLMAQRAEYRTIVNVLSEEMTRKWIEIKSVSDDKSKQDKINQLSDFMDELDVQDAFKRAAQLDFYFGRGHLFLEFGGVAANDNPEEMKHSIGDGRSATSKIKVSPQNPLTALRPVEPVWVYPQQYNTQDPTSPNWYNPERWFVMGNQVHGSRLLKMTLNEVSDLLKPAYSFGGLSMIQMAKPYVDNWLRTRQSVSDLVKGFTTYVLHTNMLDVMQGGAADSLYARMNIFANCRDNSGIMAIDKNEEEFTNVSAPIGGLDKLQAQSQEFICSVSRIPLVKFTGITPSGLNASSDEELQCFEETIKGMQRIEFRDHLDTVMDFCQLSLWGEIDDDLQAEFLPLSELSEIEQGQLGLIKAQIAGAYFETGSVGPDEIRQSIAEDPESIFEGLDLSKSPSQPGLEGMGGEMQPGEPPDPWAKLAGLVSGSQSYGEQPPTPERDPWASLADLVADPEASNVGEQPYA